MSERITSLDQIEDAEKFLAAYYRAMDEAKEMREENKGLKAQVEKAGSPDEEVAKWRTRAIRAEAKASLEGQGIKDAERILKYVDLDGVDIDDEKGLVGLDDKLGDIKKDFPELFDPKKRAGRESADIHADTPTDAKPHPLRAAVHSALNG